MADLLNLDEVFAMAVEIESNGGAFYRKAAELQSGDQYKGFLMKLADMEEDHKATFAAMRSGQAAVASEVSKEGALYFSGIAAGYDVEGSPAAADALTGSESMAQIVDTALDLEKKSILFYLGIKDLLSDASAQEQVDRIIAEEKKHVVTLNEMRQSL